MPTKCVQLIIVVAIILIQSRSFALPKDLVIHGTVMYTPDYIIRAADIDTIPANRFTFGAIANAITKLYHDNGFLLANVLLVKESLTTIIVYVDEGRLNRIVFKNLNTLDTLRIQYDFRLPHRIYHKDTLDKQILSLKKKYKLKDVKVLTEPSRNYSNALFQIDRLKKPFTNGKLPLVPVIPDIPDPQYDLIITVIPFSTEDTGGFTYGLDTSFSLGLIPFMRYRHTNLFQNNDSFRIHLQTGFMYGLNGNFTQPPYNTFNRIRSTYNFKPYFDELFIPRISSQLYHSRAGRKDLGFDQYNYVRINALAEPGFTPIEQLKVYPGYGVEKVYILDTTINPDSPVPPPDIAKETQLWHFIGIEANIDFLPFSLKHTAARKIVLGLHRYQNSTHFYKVSVDALFSFEFENFDMLVFQGDYIYFSNEVPFYYEEAVSTRCFKGFMGSDYYTTHIARASFEYELSIHRDFIYTGVYNDFVAFDGKYILTGQQAGLAYGLSLHYIFFEQFEFALWWGKDYLFSTGDSGYNLKFMLAKKW